MSTTAKSIIGKTIVSMTARPVADSLDGRGPQSMMMTLQFSDGSCYEFLASGCDQSMGQRQNQNLKVGSCHHPVGDLFSPIAA